MLKRHERYVPTYSEYATPKPSRNITQRVVGFMVGDSLGAQLVYLIILGLIAGGIATAINAIWRTW